MKFFIDTANIDKILELIPTGMVDGVTTNPSLIYKNGDDMAKTIKGICNIQNGPVSAEVTAIAMLVNYISGTPLWLTAALVIVSTLIYTLYGGLRASILTDNLQFFIVLILLLVSAYYLFFLNILVG